MGQENWATYGDSLIEKNSTTFIELHKVSKTSKIDNEKNPTSLRTKEKAYLVPLNFPYSLIHTTHLHPNANRQALENLRQEHSLTLFYPHLRQERCCGIPPGFPSSRNGFPHRSPAWLSWSRHKSTGTANNRRHNVRSISFRGRASLAVLPHLLCPPPFNPSPRYPLSCLDMTTCAAAQ